MMRREGNKLILGMKNCYCQDGTKPRPVPCTTCKGTGNGKRGGKGKCQPCYGSGRTYDNVNRITCDRCNGNYVDFEKQTNCDYLPEEIWQNLEFKVYRDARMTIGEYLIGIGCVYSVGDYGRCQTETDEKLIADVKASRSHQACKVVNENLEFCDHVGIFVSPDGYTVKPVIGK